MMMMKNLAVVSLWDDAAREDSNGMGGMKLSKSEMMISESVD
jgi:hypothetical protein